MAEEKKETSAPKRQKRDANAEQESIEYMVNVLTACADDQKRLELLRRIGLTYSVKKFAYALSTFTQDTHKLNAISQNEINDVTAANLLEILEEFNGDGHRLSALKLLMSRISQPPSIAMLLEVMPMFNIDHGRIQLIRYFAEMKLSFDFSTTFAVLKMFSWDSTRLTALRILLDMAPGYTPQPRFVTSLLETFEAPESKTAAHKVLMRAIDHDTRDSAISDLLIRYGAPNEPPPTPAASPEVASTPSVGRNSWETRASSRYNAPYDTGDFRPPTSPEVALDPRPRPRPATIYDALNGFMEQLAAPLTMEKIRFYSKPLHSDTIISVKPGYLMIGYTHHVIVNAKIGANSFSACLHSYWIANMEYGQEYHLMEGRTFILTKDGILKPVDGLPMPVDRKAQGPMELVGLGGRGAYTLAYLRQTLGVSIPPPAPSSSSSTPAKNVTKDDASAFEKAWSGKVVAEEDRCCVCMTLPRGHCVILPCFHATICMVCRFQLKEEVCPSCRGPIEKCVRLFV